MDILGISCFFHDSAAALVRDGFLIAAAEEERFTRRKHDADFPTSAIEFCLRTGQINSGDVDYVVFYEKPHQKFERILSTNLRSFPRSWRVFQEAMKEWIGQKLWIKNLIASHLGIPADRVLFSDHHLSHAASGFFCSPFQTSAILTVDGVGEWATATYGTGNDNQIEIFNQIDFPHSIGLLYSAFTAFLGFEVNEGEYKVMGMAPFGEPRYVDKIHKLIRQGSDGSFELNLEYFSFGYSANRIFSRKFENLFGAPRQPESYFFTSTGQYPSYYGDKPSNFQELAKENQYYADIAASIQVVTEEMLLKMANYVFNKTNSPNLCLAGGVFLNSVANGRIFRETPFERIYIHPSAGDGGGAVGAALYAHHMVLGRPREFIMEHAYWGEEHPTGKIEDFLNQSGISHNHIEDDTDLFERTVGYLESGKVVGWFQGKFEWGPRALGNRSILADPRRSEMKDVVNTKIKFREPFRPFAPSVLLERTEEFFESSNSPDHYPARFMLDVVNVNESKRHVIPAVTHLDGTARIQTVDSKNSQRYYQLIETFSKATGIPLLLNTSFNLRGEPIVNTPQEAVNTFLESGMDALVMDHSIIEKSLIR